MTDKTTHLIPPVVTKDPVPPKKPDHAPVTEPAVPEIGGPSGPEPTRYGDWERGGRCSDF
ncbi:MAG TPA: DUF1674 domain-containing protein [Aliidongia sp.]|uniref:succinate dehydrogenase assembly factor 4 n=1 Tax=Aliidongia sp. TaxID=1914230 RepID=UPI002DDC95D9|nr:succinate dehydrogenase assembly factor 4 [Aliidongia sp.]HEV2674873.1 DUF1674 domain-containing protein [Aliidongia sp.]